MSSMKLNHQLIKKTVTLLSLAILFAFSANALSGAREQAKRMHDRLAGVPPTESTLQQMETLINSGDPLAAAMIAVEHDDFYNVTLKNWVTPWTNEEKSIFAPLNDYTATVIGIIRDEADFRQILYDDVIYTGADISDFSNSNNVHYENLENQNANLKDVLTRRTQSGPPVNLPFEGTAGVVSSRASSRAFFIDGTNRAMFSFVMLNHLCRDLEMIKDPTRSADRVRQDVSHSPGGDSRVYFNNCLGCHAGMEPLAEAYAYYDWQYTEGNEDGGQLNYIGPGSTNYTPGVVHPKYLINENNFNDGYITVDDSWINYWREGPNSVLGWDTTLPDRGFGAKSMGIELANSHAFAECQVTKAFEAVCLREPGNDPDRTKINEMVSSFKTNYNMKQVFAESAVYCRGE